MSMSGGAWKRPILLVGAMLGFLQTYAVPLTWNRGPGGSWWEPLRRGCSRLLGVGFDERAGPRSINEDEYVGELDCPPEVVEGLLWRRGFQRNPFARLKTRNGTSEIGSWVYRPSPLAKYQIHCMLFESDSGGTDIYAHGEVSNVHPYYAPAHFNGTEQDGSAGIEFTRAVLADQEWRETGKRDRDNAIAQR